MLHAVKREAVSKEEWDAFAEASDEAWLWHLYDSQAMLATWRGRKDASFGVRDGKGVLVAIVPLKEVKAVKWGLTLACKMESMGGPAIANGIGKSHREKILKVIRAHLFELAKQNGAFEVNLMLSPMAPAYRGERCPRVNPLLDLGCENTLTQTWVVDLRQSEKEIWEKYSKECRRKIKKASSEESVVEILRKKDSALEQYYPMHLVTYKRTGATPHPKKYFDHIWEMFLPEGRAIFGSSGNSVGLEIDGVVIAQSM